MTFGISTSCFYPELTEKAAEWLAAARIPAAEVFFNAPSELAPAFLRKLRDTLDAGGTRVVSVHPFTSGLEPLLFFSEYRRRFEDGVEMYRRFFEAAAFLGASYVVLHGDRKEGKLPREEYFARYRALDEAAREHGVRLVQENVGRCRGGSAEFLAAMRKALPEALFVLDLKQARRAGEDPLALLRLLGKAVAHVHMSGCGPEGDCLPLHRGCFRPEEFLAELKRQGFSGAAVMELYREGYGEYGELAESVRILEAAAKALNA
ncbi:MAG TPA: sugar phosphate isomerase/epimerase [Candidatus Merdivicinus intestinavium]|nr:sugar phosphate isomerase/epimerase [Candidatus Merdivicinus intestinavium]